MEDVHLGAKGIVLTSKVAEVERKEAMRDCITTG